MLDLPAWDCNQEREKSWRRFLRVFGLRDEAVANLLFPEGPFPWPSKPPLILVSSVPSLVPRGKKVGALSRQFAA
jgi:hypothetical protein